jgi:hypothetical protein
VAGFCEHGDEPSGSGATKLVMYLVGVWSSSSSSSSSYGSTAKIGPWPTLLVFYNINILQGWIVSPAPNPQSGGVSVFMTPGDRVAQLYPQALGTHFSRFWNMHGLELRDGVWSSLVYFN